MKKLFGFLVVLMLISLLSFTAAAGSETNGPAVWATEAAAYLEKYQLIPNELFSDYSAPIRRDEFAAVLIGIYNEACQNHYTFPNEPDKFTDTESNKYSAEIKKANIMGFVSGTSPTEFSPDRNITREDAATLIYRFIKLMYPQEDAVLNNVIADRDQIAEYALFAVEFCLSNGIMNGTGNDMFSPKGLITRQEAMVLMYNICKRYKVIENGRGAAVTQLTPALRGLHEMVYDGYLYVRVQDFPFSFNNAIRDYFNYTLIRTPLDQSKKNQGEIIYMTETPLDAYTVNKDNIFFADRSPERAVYSTDKNGENKKLIYNMSEYTRGEFFFMHVEGDWLFVGDGIMLFKMRTDGTCLSIIHSGLVGVPFHAEGKYIYLLEIIYQDEFTISRVSITGDKTELIHSNKRYDSGWSSPVFYENKIYIAILERGMASRFDAPLIEIDIDAKNIKQVHKFSSWDESVIVCSDGVYISSIDQGTLNLKNISGGTDISVPFKSKTEARLTAKYGNYIYFVRIGEQAPSTRFYYLYNIETGLFTDIYGNPINEEEVR